VQVIALVCHLAGELREQRAVLVAVPSSVLPNWEAEFARWAPALRVASYKGSPEQREAVWERQLRRGRGVGGEAGVRVVLTTYDFLMSKADK
jgi:SNF2 family DNA or RNA helicase